MAVRRREKIFDLSWWLFFGLASTCWCVLAARALGPTFDEPGYLRWGLVHWRSGTTRPFMKAGTMPLAADVQTLPLRIAEWWRGTPIDTEREMARVLPWARAGTLLFWWLLLFYAWRGGRALGGAWGGRLAVALIACEPLMLAHAALATSDLAVATCLLMLAFEFAAAREATAPRRIWWPGILFGVALLAKASALVLGPLCLLAIECERLVRTGAFEREGWRALRGFAADLSRIALMAIVLTFVYCGSDWALEPTFVKWAQTLSPSRMQAVLVFCAENLRIFPNAGEGLVKQIAHNLRGHNVFVLGGNFRRAVWFYFPVALTIKTSIPLLLFPLAIAAVRPRALVNWACGAAALLLLDSVTWRVQLGARFLLPVLALGSVGLAAAAAHALRAPGWKARALAGWIALGIAWSAFSAARVFPNGLAYANEIWGGTRDSYHLLSDSNFDWGQGLPELRAWASRKSVTTLDVWYFGRDPSSQNPPMRELPLHSREFVAGRSCAEITAGKCVAVSITLLHGAYANEEPAHGAADFFRARTPTDRTLTFLIYDFCREAKSATPATPAKSSP